MRQRELDEHEQRLALAQKRPGRLGMHRQRDRALVIGHVQAAQQLVGVVCLQRAVKVQRAMRQAGGGGPIGRLAQHSGEAAAGRAVEPGPAAGCQFALQRGQRLFAVVEHAQRARQPQHAGACRHRYRRPVAQACAVATDRQRVVVDRPCVDVNDRAVDCPAVHGDAGVHTGGRRPGDSGLNHGVLASLAGQGGPRRSAVPEVIHTLLIGRTRWGGSEGFALQNPFLGADRCATARVSTRKRRLWRTCGPPHLPRHGRPRTS